jgi:hypothetical protein
MVSEHTRNNICSYLREAYTCRIFAIIVVIAVVTSIPASAQTATQALPVQYLKLYLTRTELRHPLMALGNRLQVAGQERLTIGGTYSDSKGTQPIQIAWELPGKIRIDFKGSSSRTIVFDGTKTASTASVASDDDLLESLGDDRAERLLYNYALHQNMFAMRFLGGHFRTDFGKNPNYTGPFYDVPQSRATVPERSDKATREKLFLFDGGTGLLAETVYKVLRGVPVVHVETMYSSWSNVSGQAVPGQIVRRENGAVIFTIAVSGAAISATAADQLFALP